MTARTLHHAAALIQKESPRPGRAGQRQAKHNPGHLRSVGSDVFLACDDKKIPLQQPRAIHGEHKAQVVGRILQRLQRLGLHVRDAWAARLGEAEWLK